MKLFSHCLSRSFIRGISADVIVIYSRFTVGRVVYCDWYAFQAQMELEKEGLDATVNKKEVFGKLAQTLTKLLNRLEQSKEGRPIKLIIF